MGNVRKIDSFVINFGLVSIPVNRYVARSSQQVSFNMLHEACSNRVSQQLYCKHCEATVTRDEIVKGLEIEKDRFVTFTDEDFSMLESEASKAITIDRFVPLGAVDPIYFEDASFLGADKGADVAYRLLHQAMLDTESAAIATMTYRGKDRLIVLRPYRQGVMMHNIFFADELRDLTDVPIGENVHLSSEHLKQARLLVNQLSDDFHPEQYRDTYTERVKKLAEQKAAGTVIDAPVPEKARVQHVDLMDALQASLKQKKPARKRA